MLWNAATGPHFTQDMHKSSWSGFHTRHAQKQLVRISHKTCTKAFGLDFTQHMHKSSLSGFQITCTKAAGLDFTQHMHKAAGLDFTQHMHKSLPIFHEMFEYSSRET